MKEKMLDNLTCQEIRELIEKKEITLQELDSDKLAELMNYEIDLLCYGEGDADIVSECSRLLDKTTEPILSKNDFQDIIARTEAENIRIVDKKPSSKRVRTVLKRTILVAVAASILVFSSACVAIKLGFDICRYIANIVRQPEGSESNIDEFTFYHNGNAKEYSSIEQMVKDENLDIMYPSKLPEGVEIQSIYVSTEINGNEVVQIFTNDTDININIELNSKTLKSSIDEIIELNGIEFYIKNEDNFYASCEYKNNKYCISAKTKDDLILIIKNLKE